MLTDTIKRDDSAGYKQSKGRANEGKASGSTPLASRFRATIPYSTLNARQKENYNFLKLSGILADYGFITMRVSADWEGADFIAQHNDGDLFLKVQLKSRLSFNKKYEKKDLYIAFRNGSGPAADWYLFPHDEVLHQVLDKGDIICNTRSWQKNGGYSCGKLSRTMLDLLEIYKLPRS